MPALHLHLRIPSADMEMQIGLSLHLRDISVQRGDLHLPPELHRMIFLLLHAVQPDIHEIGSSDPADDAKPHSLLLRKVQKAFDKLLPPVEADDIVFSKFLILHKTLL